MLRRKRLYGTGHQKTLLICLQFPIHSMNSAISLLSLQKAKCLHVFKIFWPQKLTFGSWQHRCCIVVRAWNQIRGQVLEAAEAAPIGSDIGLNCDASGPMFTC